METPLESAVLSELLDPVARCFDEAVARRIVQVRIDPQTQTRLDSLAAKCRSGEISEREREEYEAYVEALDLIGILQAKARARLTTSAP